MSENAKLWLTVIEGIVGIFALCGCIKLSIVSTKKITNKIIRFLSATIIAAISLLIYANIAYRLF